MEAVVGANKEHRESMEEAIYRAEERLNILLSNQWRVAEGQELESFETTSGERYWNLRDPPSRAPFTADLIAHPILNDRWRRRWTRYLNSGGTVGATVIHTSVGQQADGWNQGQEMNAKYGDRGRSGLRPRRKPDYSGYLGKPNDYTMLQTGLEHLEHTALTQYSMCLFFSN